MRLDLLAPLKRKIIRNMKSGDELFVSDTTLRDGEQMPGGTLLPDEKVEIARQLEALGIHSIDAGFPICCRQEVDCVRRVAESVSKPIVTALCRARKDDIDLAYEALRRKFLGKRGVSIFLASSPQHREYKLHKTRAEILDLAVEAVRYATKSFPIVSFAPEDASRTETDFLIELYERAIDAGATTIGYTDTVGCLTPEQARTHIAEIHHGVKNIDRALLAIHFHNDLGMATANSLAAISTGFVDIFQGTLLGVGERAGNASLEQVILAMEVCGNGRLPKRPKIDRMMLRPACETVARHMNLAIPLCQPVVGQNVFRTEAGIHQHGILQNPETYELYPPESVGARREFVLGKHSGKHALRSALAERGVEPDEQQLRQIHARFKEHFHARKTIAVEQVVQIAREVVRSSAPVREPVEPAS